MEESADSEGTSVDIRPADTGHGESNVITDDIDKGVVKKTDENEVELKIIEDSDVAENEKLDESRDEQSDKFQCDSGHLNENDQELNDYEAKKHTDETNTSTEEANLVERTNTEIPEISSEENTCHNDEKDNTQDVEVNVNETDKTDEDNKEVNAVEDDTKTTELSPEHNLQDHNLVEATSSATDATTEADKVTESLGLTSAEAKSADDIELTNECKDQSVEERAIETGLKKSVAKDTASTNVHKEADQTVADIDDDDVFPEDGYKKEHDSLQNQEVNSFISKVCEEMIQGMIDAEMEFTKPEEALDCDQSELKSRDDKRDLVDKSCSENIEESAKPVMEVGDQEVTVRPKQVDEKPELGNTEKDLQIKKLTTENMRLKQELAETRTTVHATQSHVRDQQVRHNAMMMMLKMQLYQTQTALKQQQSKSDQQMSEVMSHLLVLEGRLKREQCRVKNEMKLKNELIKNQKLEILKLREQNDQLLNAIKEIYAKGGMNGYMRDKKKGATTPDGSESGKSGKDKKVHNGKLNTVKDKFSWKNRSSLELNNFDLEKYLIKNQRLYSSHEDLHNVSKSNSSRSVSGAELRALQKPRKDNLRDGQSPESGDSNGDLKRSPRNSQNFFYEDHSPKPELSTSVSESSQLSEHSSTSGFHSLSDHDLSNQDMSLVSNHHGDNDFDDNDDDDDGRYFSFSSTRINTVIDEEDVSGGMMMSMGSMPLLANLSEDQLQRLRESKNRPHSLSSVDLISIQQQAESLSHLQLSDTQSETSTPPPSPSLGQNKNELTPFQTFKTMFKRKGSKNKGHKKRSVSLSQTTNKEYTEAMKKHFQKYDMS